jgi:hypothetical protein
VDTHSTDTAASHLKDEGAKGNLASIRPNFIVKDLQTSITQVGYRGASGNGPQPIQRSRAAAERTLSANTLGPPEIDLLQEMEALAGSAT